MSVKNRLNYYNVNISRDKAVHRVALYVLIFTWVKWSIWGLSALPMDTTSKQWPNISLKTLHQAEFETARQASDIDNAPRSNHCAMSLSDEDDNGKFRLVRWMNKI